MRQKNTRFLILIVILLLVSVACNLPGQAASQVNINTQVQQTVQVELTRAAEGQGTTNDAPFPTEAAPETPPTAAVNPTATPEPSFTPTITLTPTPAFPTISVDIDTNCRFGPHVVYEYLGALMVGEVGEIVGRVNGNESWVLINNPDRNGTCWVSTAFGTVQGDMSSVPLVEVPPFYDWNGTFTIWLGPALNQETLNLTQNGTEINGIILLGPVNVLVNAVLSANGQEASGLMSEDPPGDTASISFYMLENMNQFRGSMALPDGTLTQICGARNGAARPNPCLWP